MVTRDQIDTVFDVFEPPSRDGRRLIAERTGEAATKVVADNEPPWERTGSMTMLELMHTLEPDKPFNG